MCAFGRTAVAGYGPMPASVLLVGEAPGAEEVIEGRVPEIKPTKNLMEALKASIRAHDKR